MADHRVLSTNPLQQRFLTKSLLVHVRLSREFIYTRGCCPLDTEYAFRADIVFHVQAQRHQQPR